MQGRDDCPPDPGSECDTHRAMRELDPGDRLDHLGNLHRPAPADLDVHEEGHQIPREPRASQEPLPVVAFVAAERDSAHERAHVHALADPAGAVDPTKHLVLGQRTEAIDLAGEPRLSSLVGEHRPRDRDEVASAVDDARDRRVLGSQGNAAREPDSVGRPVAELRGDGDRIDVGRDLHVDELAEARNAERERGAEHHLGLRVEAARVVERELEPAERARQCADQVEVRQKRARPELRVLEPIATRLPLHDPRRRPFLPLGLLRQRLRVHPLLRAEAAQVDDPLLAHRREIARDAAVVADELSLVRASVLEVGGVDERARHLAAGRREPALDRLAVLAREEPLLETDVDVVPGQARGHRDRPEVPLRVDPLRVERRLPHVDLQLVLPRVEARPRAVRALEHVAQAPIAAREDPLEPRRLAVVHREVDAGLPRFVLRATPASSGRRPRRPSRTTGTACAAWGRG